MVARMREGSMSDDLVRWEINYRHVRLKSERLSAIGLNLFYPDRQCELCIEFSPPVDAATPANTVVIHEFRRLHETLVRILGE
jgi:hypothetical protein